MPRIIVTGCRSWDCKSLATKIVGRLVERYGAENVVIVHGAMTGVDQAFENAALLANVATDPHPAAWDDLDAPGAVPRARPDGTVYNANAGPQRNALMVSKGADWCIAVHRSLSKSFGTKDCVRRCLRAGIRVFLHDSVKGEPMRITSV